MRPLVEASIREAATAAMQPVQDALLANLQDIVQENFERALERYRMACADSAGAPGSGIPHGGKAEATSSPSVGSSADLGACNTDPGHTFVTSSSTEAHSSPWLPWDHLQWGADSHGVDVDDFNLDNYEWAMPEEPLYRGCEKQDPTSHHRS